MALWAYLQMANKSLPKKNKQKLYQKTNKRYAALRPQLCDYRWGSEDCIPAFRNLEHCKSEE
jgi:hypothetical protein